MAEKRKTVNRKDTEALRGDRQLSIVSFVFIIDWIETTERLSSYKKMKITPAEVMQKMLCRRKLRSKCKDHPQTPAKQTSQNYGGTKQQNLPKKSPNSALKRDNSVSPNFSTRSMLPALPVALAASPPPPPMHHTASSDACCLATSHTRLFRLLLLVASFLITDMEASSVANRLGPGMTRMDRVMEYFVIMVERCLSG
ncbi:hypothetical protein CEXT_800031 [Caerostris extrusa]|uniref:Uncharacterized protein n=1 Tax=Caerostris extrusa TaxID=172846 RepID=A0AAV4MT14_CAEEX|nr:hypothetical protein CEXT_800031 [Caerostris extrusa]